MSQRPSSPMVPVEAAIFELVRALSRRARCALEERHHGGAITPNPASSRTGAPSRRNARMPVASVVWSQGAISASAGPSEGTSRAARPRPRRRCSSGCAAWRSKAVSSGPSAHTVAADTSRLGSSTACRANSIRHSSTRSGRPIGRRPLWSTTSSAPPGTSSSSTTGGMIRKHVRTGSASVVAMACQASSRPASTASSSSSASTDPSGEANAASHASTAPLVLGRRRRSAGWRAGANRRASASVKPHMRERSAWPGASGSGSPRAGSWSPARAPAARNAAGSDHVSPSIRPRSALSMSGRHRARHPSAVSSSDGRTRPRVVNSRAIAAARAAAMALELTTRGRVLPSLELTADGWRARWRPLIDSADRGRIEGLTWSLPAAFLAAGALAGDHDPARGDPEPEAPGHALRSLMWGFTDALARRFAPARQPADRRRRPRTRGPVDAWLAALASPDGSVDADDDELAVLAGRLDAWQATATTLAEPVRTCFRIIPPVGDDEDLPRGADDVVERSGRRPMGRPERVDEWRIEFALQAVDDPSLLVSAATVWADGPELTALERHVAHPDEQLLRGLGRAARLVPSLGPALAEMAPCDQTTDATGILAFLRDGAPVLEEAGFGVMAPPWWRSSRARLALRLKARTNSKIAASTGTIGLEGLCDIRWEAVLGDDKLGLVELRQLARLKQPLVRLRGQWVELHEEDLAAAITAVAPFFATAEQMSAGEVLRTALGLEQATGGLLEPEGRAQ